MTGPKKRVEAEEREAAEWHARLGASPVDAEVIEAFFAWRQEPRNADAYRRIEAVWTNAGRLGADPEVARALDAALARGGRSRGRPVLKAAFGFGAAAATLVLVFGLWSWAGARGTYATAVGEQRTIQLADGSLIRLDTASRVRVRFAEGRRSVDLEDGQALFTVAHDPSRPFVVQAGEAAITAVGTVFDVRRLETGAEVTLVSGAVDVSGGTGAGARRMQPGHQARVTGQTVRTAVVDAAAETSWAEGRVVFRDTPLRLAVEEVNRYLTDKIVLDAPSLEAETVNGVFRTGDRQAFVSAATATLNLKASAGADGEVRLSGGK